MKLKNIILSTFIGLCVPVVSFANEPVKQDYTLKFGLSKTDDVYKNIEYIVSKSSEFNKIRHPAFIGYHGVDINDDGVNEIIVKNTDPEICQLPKCPLFVAKINSDKTDWDIVLETMSWQEELHKVGKKVVLTTKTVGASYEYDYNSVSNSMNLNVGNLGLEVDVRKFSDLEEDYQGAVEYALSEALGERYLIMKNQNPNLNNVFLGEGDLNYDELNEFFLYFDLDGNCGLEGLCEIYVYTDFNNSPIIKLSSSAQNFVIGKPRPDKISDLLYKDGSQWKIYEWDINKNTYIQQ